MPTFRLANTVLGTPDPAGLARFYLDLLGWQHRDEDPEDDWIVIKAGGPDDTSPGLSFMREDDHVPPAWPAGPGDQQMQLHLDVAVDDLPAAVARAVELGAREASYQPQELVRVMLAATADPICPEQDDLTRSMGGGMR